MSLKKEKFWRVLTYVGLGVLALTTAVILVLVAQMPDIEYKGRHGGAAQVNK
jgi:hypothetical protein